MHPIFKCISLSSLHEYEVKFPNFAFYGGSKREPNDMEWNVHQRKESDTGAHSPESLSEVIVGNKTHKQIRWGWRNTKKNPQVIVRSSGNSTDFLGGNNSHIWAFTEWVAMNKDMGTRLPLFIVVSTRYPRLRSPTIPYSNAVVRY